MVFWLVNKPEVGHNVFDFFAIIETLATYNTIWHAITDKRFFNRAGLSVRAIQYGNVFVITEPGICSILFPTRNCFAFGAFVGYLQHTDFISPPALRPKLFV